MKLAIVILNYNTYKMTLKLIDKLIQILPNNDNKCIIVVDNASTNESARILEDNSCNGNRYYFIKSEKNAGYAAGNNIGLRYANSLGADFVLVSNNDIEIDSYDIIKNMIQLMNSNDRIGAISPRIISKNGKKDPPLYFKRPSFWDMTGGILENHKQRFKFDENRICPIYAPRGSFMLLRSSMLERIDYLDEGTFLYCEEPILAERLLNIGAECWLCGDVMVIHNHGETINTAIKKKNICDILCKSYKYYLGKYRKMNALQITVCVFVRRTSYMLRR